MKKFLFIFGLFFIVWVSVYGDDSPVLDLCNKNVPGFQLPDEKGVMHTSSECKGKWHILFFLPKRCDKYGDLCFFKEAYPWLAQQNVELFCVSGESHAEVKDAKERLQIPFTMLCDQTKTVLNKVTKTPYDRTTLFVDEQGVIRKVIQASVVETHLLEIVMFLIKKNITTKKLNQKKEAQTGLTQSKTAPWGLLGEKALNFKLPNEQGKIWELNDSSNNRWRVLLFLPEKDTPIQQKHLLFLAQAYDWLQGYAAEIVWISSNTILELGAIKNCLGIPFITLSDNQRSVSRQYDISSTLHETYTTLIVDKFGVVREVITDMTAERHVLKTLFFFMKRSPD